MAKAEPITSYTDVANCIDRCRDIAALIQLASFGIEVESDRAAFYHVGSSLGDILDEIAEGMVALRDAAREPEKG
ncbi:hypothetical protein [Methylobrevis pamukkalensis]|uniref:Uncharacterized protein n=1 Tax=Methylobrevis pamukkalensis TaxID=1439726 RepID=A0A1E3GNU8_9HYPH|nr:hypothetical protein [Methylobrevis pamukkalensis]ODN65615.1 hypothetical protein A6302_04512 [Methylobrevis pamukkalensis]